MTVESMLDYKDMYNSTLRIMQGIPYTRKNTDGEDETAIDSRDLHLITFDPTDYKIIRCITTYYLSKPQFIIELLNEVMKDYINIATRNKKLASTVYKRILNNQDCWASDLAEDFPEIFL